MNQAATKIFATGSALAAALMKNKLGNKFQYGSDWVTWPVHCATDAAHAIWLFRLNYRRINKEPVEELTLEIKG